MIPSETIYPIDIESFRDLLGWVDTRRDVLATNFESGGWGFESLAARQLTGVFQQFREPKVNRGSMVAEEHDEIRQREAESENQSWAGKLRGGISFVAVSLPKQPNRTAEG